MYNTVSLKTDKSLGQRICMKNTDDLFVCGLAGLGSKKKKQYKNIMIENDSADKFRKMSKILKVTQTELLEYMMTSLEKEAQSEKDNRVSK